MERIEGSTIAAKKIPGQASAVSTVEISPVRRRSVTRLSHRFILTGKALAHRPGPRCFAS